MRWPVILSLLLLSAPAAHTAALDGPDQATYRDAFAAAKRGDWDSAEGLAAQGREELLRKALHWLRLVSPGPAPEFSDIADFIAANPGWPRMERLRRRAEEAMSPSMSHGDVLAWFADRRPATADGAERLATALMAAGRRDEAAILIRDAWHDMDMSSDQEDRILKAFGGMLRPRDQEVRLDRLLWDERTGAAKRQMRRVGADWQKLAQARIALMERSGNANTAIAQVPARLQDDPGLVYERVRWRRRAELDDGALELLKEPPADLREPGKWWIERRIQVRRLLQNGDSRGAYRLASEHGQVEAVERAEAEWLSGWIALRFLHENETAFVHFKTLYENVQYPISLSRGAYWAGRAAADAGKADIARMWYATAAQYMTTFYGQLAAANLPEAERPAIPPEPEPTDADIAGFDGNELVRVVRFMAAAGAANQTDSFLRKLADDKRSPAEWVLLGRLARQIGRQDLGVHVAKQAMNDGVLLTEHGYPALSMPEPATDPALVHAVVRQESSFAPNAVSFAGARGLMQLMPATAERMAKDLRLPFSSSRLIDDPEYNLQLGQAYLSRMLQRYDGSLILALAAYNAGPSRVDRWLTSFGPLGGDAETLVDWIESIPFQETRNYVQRVIETRTVYGARQSGSALTLTIARFMSEPKEVVLP
ncbi:MAG: lytic transglycosylase domain-containing protein [Alphaproteobacteria bacterium]